MGRKIEIELTSLLLQVIFTSIEGEARVVLVRGQSVRKEEGSQG